MASRRTRIKGIAHIPQRRKTLNPSTNAEEDVKISPEFGHSNSDQPNLKVKHEISDDNQNRESSKTEEISPLYDVVKKAESTEKALSNVTKEQSEPPQVYNETSDELTLGLSEEIPKNVDNLPQSDPKSVVPVRRKFIKPTVSLNAINRKPKDVEEVRPIQVNNQPPPKNSKIIILNEIITYASQNQHVEIQDRSANNIKEELNIALPQAQNILLKPPEASIGKSKINSLERDVRRLVPSSPQLLTPDVEYPAPSPSPNKVNRSRIKAVPRLGQRNTSFSASESEDESRRNHRHRNDSICSSASGLQDTNSIPECPSPQKPKEFNSVIQRKCRRTEQSRKLAEARRDFYLKFGNKKPDRQKLTMIDLIFYNPVTNPMSNDNKNKRKISEVETENNEEEKIEEEETVDDPPKSGSDEENEIPAPQIKIGPQGEIVVDEQSLVIENKSVKKHREEIEKSKVVNGDFDTGYGVYKRAKRSKDWSKHETLKFYKALNTIGTDFTLMCELFPRRSRRELKMKFKKEERVNKTLVDKAIMQPCSFDFNDFKHEVDMEEKELLELEKQKERERQMKVEAKKRKTGPPIKKEPLEKTAKLSEAPKKKKKKALDIMNVLEDDESDADESEVESVEDDEGENTLLQTIQKPTRSGRVPKILDRYKAPEPDSKAIKAKPGSLIVVAGTGPNGQPVYRVCMVTGEHGRQQIGQDMTSLQKALQCKENGCIESLFTLSATTTEILENNQTIPAVENNITIPADEEVNTHATITEL